MTKDQFIEFTKIIYKYNFNENKSIELFECLNKNRFKDELVNNIFYYKNKNN